MNRIVEVTFTKSMTEGNDVGYMSCATGTATPKKFVVGYSAEQPETRRFSAYVNQQVLNLGDYVDEADMKRLEATYFDFRTSDKKVVSLTVQFKSCLGVITE
ncbi:hypothetical protein ACE3L8_12370 [Staphylococcus simulans]|uniref:hypothetical protein n=1 Tax=Staphylococcus simulans TaxID=1286 RepID=UPI003659101E